MAQSFTGQEPAKLYRSDVKAYEEFDHACSEEIGSGPLDKMVRLALTDPDDEVWRYAIGCEGQLICGNHIRHLQKS